MICGHKVQQPCKNNLEMKKKETSALFVNFYKHEAKNKPDKIPSIRGRRRWIHSCAGSRVWYTLFVLRQFDKPVKFKVLRESVQLILG